jgi:hypothetical protein
MSNEYTLEKCTNFDIRGDIELLEDILNLHVKCSRSGPEIGQGFRTTGRQHLVCHTFSDEEEQAVLDVLKKHGSVKNE